MPPDSATKLGLPDHELKIPAVLMRGGTSRGLIFKREDLPARGDANRRLWDLIFLSALGSPDPRQLDGVGAGDSHCSKVAVLNQSPDDAVDVEFLFAEVAIDEARVDYAGNSGNIISAVGLFAVEEGWVAPVAPKTRVRIRNLNTDKMIEVLVPVEHGRTTASSTFCIDGVPGQGPEIEMRFPDPGASICSHLLPAGEALSELSVAGIGSVQVSLVDAANPIVLIDGKALKVDPETPVATLNSNTRLLASIQAIRAQAAVACGLVPDPEDAWHYSPMVPFPVLVFAASDVSRVDLCVRVISLGRFHKAINVTVSVAITAASHIPGCLIRQLCPNLPSTGRLRIGHPSGRIQTRCEAATVEGRTQIQAVSISRTARRIMQGEILVQPGKLRWLASL